jgi:transcriptional regulator with XRE-family HTH domain
MKLYGSLDNYIAMHRKRLGLSQAELSVLVFIENRGSVSRYEQGVRLPDLETLLALEIVLGAPIQALFAGVAEHVRDNVTRRAQSVLESLGDTPTVENAAKLSVLAKLAHPDEPFAIPVWEDAA